MGFYTNQLSADAKDAMSSQTVNFKMDCVAKTVSIDIQQPVAKTELIEVISAFTNAPIFNSELRAVILDGGEGVLGAIKLSGLKTIQHKFELDYAGTGVVNHELVFKYDTLLTK